MKVVRSNFVARESFFGFGEFSFLVAFGHVRSGKTRTGKEIPGIIDAIFESERQVVPAVYLDVDFLYGAKFNSQFDMSHVTPSQALGSRLLACLAIDCV